MAHYEDIEIDQGTDVVIQLELFNPDGSRKTLLNWDSDLGSFHNNYDMTGKIKKSYNSSDSAVLFGCTAYNPQNKENILELSLTNVQTDAMRAGRFVYDVEIASTDSDGLITVERILQGNLTLVPSVTR
mgnify:FL=1|tara:strand:- start:47970 stop:48356 length:387 start_codon:yes stop_codon:yes gene_type:complete